MDLLKKTINAVRDLDRTQMDKAQEALDYLLKPQGSLGKLEHVAKQLAGITGKLNNTIGKKVIMVMGGDNGIANEKVSSFPKEVSLLVAQCMDKGISGVSVLARHAGAELRIADLGIDGDVEAEGIVDKKISRSTKSFLSGPAMSRDEAVRAIETGIEMTSQAIDDGATLLGTGEIGIGNTTTSSAVLYVLSNATIDDVVGRGAGLDDEGLARKKEVILKGVEINKPDRDDPLDILAKLGGFDIAGLTGCYLAAAAHRVPIVIDGFISGVAALIAAQLCEKSVGFMIASHGSVEPGSRIINNMLGLKPMLDMEMRLGEGTGCALAFNIIEAATKMMNEMGTFGDIGM